MSNHLMFDNWIIRETQMILLYIDPGTGSMLFTVLLGVIGAAIYSLRMLWMKLKFVMTGGKVQISDKKIPFVIYSDDKRYWNIFEPICKEMNARGKDVVYMTSSKDDPVFNCAYEHITAEYIGEDNKAFAKLNFLKANILLSTTPGLDVYQWKRSKEVDYYVHIAHASNDITLYRMFGIDYYDAILLSGEYQVTDLRNLEKLRALAAKELYKVGIPYMDVMAERLAKAGEHVEHPRTVLLAPSWGPSAILSVYGEQIIEKLLETGYQIIIRPHPQSFKSEKDMINNLMKKYPDSEQLSWNRDNDNFEVLRKSDIMISDFSGVLFEFALIYGKPIIYTDPNFDIAPYDAWWLDTPLWTLSALPRLGCELTSESMKNLKIIIDECITDDSFAEGRDAVKRETWEYIGVGASRTVDYLINKYEELTREEK